jgi:antitoxin component of RelBE/YafQ-DinJ toxin-antitoxin module
MYVQTDDNVLKSWTHQNQGKEGHVNKKAEVFQFRISEDDRQRMEVLAQRNGVSMAGAIRMLLRQAVSEEELPDERPANEDEEEDAALGRHASKIYAAVHSGKEKPVSLAEVKAELVAAGVLDA